MLKIAPTLIVEKVEPTVDFMVEKLSFEKTAEVPGENGLNFAMLVSGNVEIHVQTRRSAAEDIPYFDKAAMPPSSFLYIDIEDVSSLYEKLKHEDIVLPLRKTFYGATHFFIREPGGHVLGFSENKSSD